MANYSVSVVTADGEVPFVSGAARSSIARFVNLLRKFESGNTRVGTNTLDVRNSSVAATGTITLASCPAGQCVEVNGVEFYAISGTPVVANREFDISGSDTADAVSLVTTLNTYFAANQPGLFVATSALGVVTLTATQPGRASNSISIVNKGILSSGTFTCASLVAADTITINGQALTARASGAVVNEFNLGGTDTLDAAAMAAAINLSTNAAIITSHVSATSAAAVVTVRAKYSGLVGNSITTANSAHATAGQTRLTGGTDVSTEGVKALSTVTISGGSGNYTVTINGVNASGTVAYNSTDTQTATDIAAAINSGTNPLVRAVVFATSSSGVVTISAARGGVSGNAITLACTGTGATAALARLATGALPTTVVLSGARLASGSDTYIQYVV